MVLHVISMLPRAPYSEGAETSTEGGTTWRREGEHVTIIADMETNQ